MRTLPGALTRKDNGQNRFTEQELLPWHGRQSLNAPTSNDYVEASFLASLDIVREAVFLWKIPLETPS
jgi:hypothetical protein